MNMELRMLLNLRIKDFAIIDEAELELSSGFTVVTGETGAGKSILIDALTIVLGGRASATVIRTGAGSAQVEALFDLSGHPTVKARLEQRALVGDDVDVLLVRRVVAAKGRGKVLINEHLSTVATLGEIVRGLVDISGQNDQQSLLMVENHLDLLDSYSGVGAERKSYNGVYQRAAAAAKDLVKLERASEASLAQLDFLRYQFSEMERVAPVPGEDGDLEREARRLNSAEKLEGGTRLAEHLLYSEDGSAFDKIGKAVAEIEALVPFDSDLRVPLDGLESARRELEEAARTLGSYGDRVESDPVRLEEIEERLAALRRLCRKHGGTLEDVLARQEELRVEVERLENSDARMEGLVENIRVLKEELVVCGKRLRKARLKGSKSFAAAVRGELQDMELNNAVFEVRLVPREMAEGEESGELDGAGPTGLDDVEFFWSANKGERVRALHKTASGGELSRLMLAVKHVLCSHDLVSLYVFDEVDTGLGGKAADSIGKKIQTVAVGHQAITITHLASIAVRADHHIFVTKETLGSRTVSALTPIEGAARVKEIARMIDGAPDNQATQAAAADMLNRAARGAAA